MYAKCISKNSFKTASGYLKNIFIKKLFLINDYDIFMGRRRRIVSSAVIFRANLLRTRMMCATGISCEVPLCRLVICRMQLSFMAKL